MQMTASLITLFYRTHKIFVYFCAVFNSRGMKIKKEIKIGFYFALMMLALVWGVNFLKGRDIFGKVNTFYAVYDNVEGLRSTSQVYVKGMKVGTVKTIKLNQKTEKFSVELQIKSNYQIPKNSIARIYSDDIMGNKAIRIVLGDTSEMLKDKDLINSAVDVDMFATLADDLPTIKDRLSSAILKADDVLANVNKLLDEKNLRNLSDGIASFTNVMANLEQLTGTLNKSRGSITNILNNLDSLSASLNGNSDRINNTLENIYILSDSLKNLPLAETVNEIKTTLAKFNSNDGTVGKLMNNDSLYNNLSKTVESMDLLLNDLRNNPKRYLNISVFGRKNK